MSAKPKDRNQHIKVFTRIRPRNAQEMRSHIVVECVGSKEIVVKDKAQLKTFAFDRVFGPESKQIDVYKTVVAPLISEVLQGYNCTVFAYGQTGTGKTFTMIGDRDKSSVTSWETDPLCGIIPRTLDHLFDELKLASDESTVRISFLELYNEELFDLLAPIHNEDGKVLRLFEDSMKKGSVIVAGLEERTVYGKNDVYPILEQGSLRRQTAHTLMNAQSSRSHTIFTITVHVKVTTPEGEELFKTGKLNLVDLAGSENIGRSGAVDMRAREAGNINQSLLTLGRVITSLVERAPHVPYRESKLTRLLQDSLGGRTKTSIIATISPAMSNLEETLSTLEYANRARNITIKPEINQRTSKHVLLKNYTDEIERLRRDLMATREKHGVFMQLEDYNAMTVQSENMRLELSNKIQMLKVREDELTKQEEIMATLNMNLTAAQTDITEKEELIRSNERDLVQLKQALNELSSQALSLYQLMEEAAQDAKRLHDRLEMSRRVNKHNADASDHCFRNVNALLSTLTNYVRQFRTDTQAILTDMSQLTDTQREKVAEHVVRFEEGCHGFRKLLESHLSLVEAPLASLDANCQTFVSTASDLCDQLGQVAKFSGETAEQLVHMQAASNLSRGIVLEQMDLHEKQQMEVFEGYQRVNGVVSQLAELVTALQQLLPTVQHSLAEQRTQSTNHFNSGVKRISEELRKRQAELLGQLREQEAALEMTRMIEQNVKEQTEALRVRLERSELMEKQLQDQIEKQNGSLEATRRTQREIELLISQEQQKLGEIEKEQEEWIFTEKGAFDRLSKYCKLVADALGIPEEQRSSSTLYHQLYSLMDAFKAVTTIASKIKPELLEYGKKEEIEWSSLRETLSQQSRSLQTTQQEGLQRLLANGSSANSSMTSAMGKLKATRMAAAEFAAQTDELTQFAHETVSEVHRQSRAMQTQLQDRVNIHADYMFNSFHECSNEFKIHFKEKLLKDEQTGTTPQRREFSYQQHLLRPKVLADITNELTENNVPSSSPKSTSSNTL